MINPSPIAQSAFKIIPLSEGAFTVDKTKKFVPFEVDIHELQHRTSGSLLVEVQPFLVITPKEMILIDTGLGFSKNGRLQLHHNLLANGIQPAQITKVLMSHLHKDRAGGISQRDSFGHYHLSFTNATYYVQEKEFEFAMDTGASSYLIDEISALHRNPQVEWLNGNGIIDNYISYEVTSAHSPFHQIFWMAENKEKIFFGGDDAPQLQQLKNKFIAKYDYDGKKCMLLRQEWKQRAEIEGWTFLFYHDIKTPIYTVPIAH